jgi:hypothetical protein
MASGELRTFFRPDKSRKKKGILKVFGATALQFILKIINFIDL